MRRRRFIQALAAAPAGPALLAQQAAPAPATEATREVPEAAPLDFSVADEGADPVPKFFSARQFATLKRLCDLLMPAAPGSPGATVVLQLFLREHFGWWPVSTRKLDRGSHASFRVGSRGAVRARVVLTMADGATPLAVSPTLRLPPARPSRAR